MNFDINSHFINEFLYFLLCFSFETPTITKSNTKTKQSRTKCFPQSEHSTHNGTVVKSTTNSSKNTNTYMYIQTTEGFTQTPQTAIGFHHSLTNYKTDRLLSEANLISPLITTPPTFKMTKTMEPFLDGHNITMTSHSMDGFSDDLMTPVIGKFQFYPLLNLDCCFFHYTIYTVAWIKETFFHARDILRKTKIISFRSLFIWLILTLITRLNQQ